MMYMGATKPPLNGLPKYRIGWIDRERPICNLYWPLVCSIRMHSKIEIAGIEITHPEKVMFPLLGLTKRDFVEYYDKISAHILPYLKDRPLTLQRFPEGIDVEGFYQKNASDYFPDFIELVKIKTEEGYNQQVICNDKKTLIYLINQGTITLHIWLSRKDKLRKPDKVIFDLDPPEGDFEKAREAAHILGEFLKGDGKVPELMTTGKNGLHIYYSRRRTADFDEVREEVKAQAHELADQYPQLLTTEVRKDKRKGRVFLDYLRNAYGQTAVCPYSLRPIESAGVATPIKWDELDKVDSGDYYNYKNIFRRLAQL